jgi:hypothetical protein
MKTIHCYPWREAAVHGTEWYERAAVAYCGHKANPKIKLKLAGPNDKRCTKCSDVLKKKGKS